MICYCKSNFVCLISQLFFVKYLFPNKIFLPIIRCLLYLFLVFKHFLKLFGIIIFYILSKVPKHQVVLKSLCLLQRSKSPPKNKKYLQFSMNFEHSHQEFFYQIYMNKVWVLLIYLSFTKGLILHFSTRNLTQSECPSHAAKCKAVRLS